MCPKPHLYPREIQVLKLAGAGYTTSQIASILNCGYGTVATHKRRAFRKLFAFSLPHALVIAHKLGVLSVDDIDPIRVSFMGD